MKNMQFMGSPYCGCQCQGVAAPVHQKCINCFAFLQMRMRNACDSECIFFILYKLTNIFVNIGNGICFNTSASIVSPSGKFTDENEKYPGAPLEKRLSCISILYVVLFQMYSY